MQNPAARLIVQVFVAGATGNTGKRVVQQLSAKGIQVLPGTRVSPTHLHVYSIIQSRSCIQHADCSSQFESRFPLLTDESQSRLFVTLTAHLHLAAWHSESAQVATA